MKQRYDSYKPSGVEWIGEIPSHWNVVRIKNIISLLTDYDANGSFADIASNCNINEGKPYAWMVRATDLENKRYGIVEGNNYCDRSTYDYLSKSSLVADDILIAKRGDIGKSYLVPLCSDPMTLAPNTYLLKTIKSSINNHFFYHYLQSFSGKESLKLENKSTTLGALYKDDVKRIFIPLPPLAEQEAIAAWLDEKSGEIDAAIAKVDREIELIDELKQSEISRVVTRGLNHNVKLRPSGIDWIGEIPEHWIIAPFKRAMTINNGCDYKHIVCEDGYPVIGSGGQFAYASDYLYDGEVLLLGRKGTIDRPIHFVGKFWTVDTMFYAVPNNEVCCKFMYYQSLGFPFYYYSTATALPSMAASDLANNPIVVPPLSEQCKIADYLDKKCAEIDGLKSKLKKKRDTLVELRQSMISEVVTGKRKVV